MRASRKASSNYYGFEKKSTANKLDKWIKEQVSSAVTRGKKSSPKRRRRRRSNPEAEMIPEQILYMEGSIGERHRNELSPMSKAKRNAYYKKFNELDRKIREELKPVTYSTSDPPLEDPRRQEEPPPSFAAKGPTDEELYALEADADAYVDAAEDDAEAASTEQAEEEELLRLIEEQQEDQASDIVIDGAQEEIQDADEGLPLVSSFSSPEEVDEPVPDAGEAAIELNEATQGTPFEVRDFSNEGGEFWEEAWDEKGVLHVMREFEDTPSTLYVVSVTYLNRFSPNVVGFLRDEELVDEGAALFTISVEAMDEAGGAMSGAAFVTQGSTTTVEGRDGCKLPLFDSFERVVDFLTRWLRAPGQTNVSFEKFERSVDVEEECSDGPSRVANPSGIVLPMAYALTSAVGLGASLFDLHSVLQRRRA